MKSTTMHRITALLLLLCLLLTVAPLTVQAESKALSSEEFLSLLDYDQAVEDVSYLSQTIGTRPAGSASEQLALDYVATECEKLGYEISRQEYSISGSMGNIYLGDFVLAATAPAANSYYTGFTTAEGTALYLDDPANVASLGEDLSGKVVFFPGNWRSGKDPDTYTAITALDAANAAGVVVMMDLSIYEAEKNQKSFPSMTFSNLGTSVSTPLLLVNAMESERVPAYLAKNTDVSVKLERESSLTSENILALKKASVETEQTIYVSAHVDSVIPSPGANDNGSGVAGVLAMARAFAHIETNYNIAFTFFGSEEIGLVGSKKFTSAMTADQIAKALGNYNLDMVATGDLTRDTIYMDSCTGNAALDSPSLELRVSRQARKAAEALGYDMSYYRIEYNTASDHSSFHRVGIPAIEFIWCDSSSHPDVEPYYHTACDNMEMNFSREKLQKQVDAIALAVYNDASADYVAMVGSGVRREYYTSMEEALAAAGESGTVTQLKLAESEALKLGHSLDLASDISLNFAVLKTALEGYDLSTVYVESTVETIDAEGNATTNTLKLYPEEKEYHYYFTLNGLTAVEMSDTITSTLYGVKDGFNYCSPMDSYSIADYAYSQMSKEEAPATLKTLCADLLRYGSKAQIYKEYRTDSLADASMTEEEKLYLSDAEAVSFGNTNSMLKDLESPAVTWLGKSLDLASKVTLNFICYASGYEGDMSHLTAKLSYEGIDGATEEVILRDPKLYDGVSGVYVFSFDGLLAAELRSVVSIQIYEGNTPLSVTLQYSADTYGNNKEGTLLELCKALFAYCDSAKAYFSA